MQKNERRDRIEEILGGLSPQSVMSVQTTGIIDRWFIDGERDAEIGSALKGLFERYDAAAGAPSRECMETLRKVQRRLGMRAAGVSIPLYRKIYFRLATAAAVLVAVLGIAFSGGSGMIDSKALVAAIESAPHTAVETIEGVQKEIVLGDGTMVWVNSDSRMVSPQHFAGDQRHVSLSGEAFFEVSHDPAKPFYVHTDKLHVKVLGTKFNVDENADEATTVVTLHEGLVEVIAGERSEKLLPNQQLTYYHLTGEMEVVNLAAPADWRSDVIYARNRTLPQLFRMISNFYDVEVVFDEADFAAGELFTSSFGKDLTAEKVIDALSILENGFGHRSENGVIKIYREQPKLE